MEVPALRTPMDGPSALAALLAGGCPRAALAMVAAQSAVETDAWRAMWRWNFGNVTAAGAQDYQILPGNPLHFRAFASPTAGAAAMVAWLARRGCLPYAEAGDLDGFVAALERSCYLGCLPPSGSASQADYDSYRRAIAARMRELSGVTPAPSPGGTLAWWVAAASVTFLAWSAGWLPWGRGR